MKEQAWELIILSVLQQIKTFLMVLIILNQKLQLQQAKKSLLLVAARVGFLLLISCSKKDTNVIFSKPLLMREAGSDTVYRNIVCLMMCLTKKLKPLLNWALISFAIRN